MTTQTEIPGINNAVAKLEELGIRMRSDDFGFHDNDVGNLDKVIEALHELEQERHRLHDELETETIKASVNRHKLQFLPAEIKDEIMVAVNSARQSNAQAQEELQGKLDGINKNIIYLGERHQDLEKENSVLHPERELVRQQHEEIISQLNQRMAEKASMQIALNETRDKVRQANQNIVDLEDGILQLKEDLIQERTEARQEKKRLKRAVADTAEKTNVQREQNMGKKKELDSFQEQLMDSEGKLDALRKSIRRFETSKSRMEEEERNLNKKLNREIKTNTNLKEKGEFIVRETEKEQQDFAEKESELIKKIERFEKDIEEEEEVLKDLEINKSSLQAEVRERLEKRKDDSTRVAGLDAQLQLAKQNLTKKAEEVGRMQAENIDMTEEIENLGESHKAVVAQLNKQLEEFRELLNNERKERLDLQGRKDNVHKELEEFKTEQQRFMQSVNMKIQEGKTKHVELSNEGAQIQKDLRREEEEIKKLQSELTKVENDYEEMFSTLNSKTTSMESLLSGSASRVWSAGSTSSTISTRCTSNTSYATSVHTSDTTEQPQGEIVSMETGVSEKTDEVEQRTPVFHELEMSYEERTEGYDKMKKEVVVLKNKKIGLEDAIVKSKREKEALAPVLGKLREDLKQLRSDSLNQMKSLGDVTQDTEKQIYVEGSKLKTVMEENHKFEESCRKLEADIEDIQKQMEMTDKLTGRLQTELVTSKEELIASWESDRVMQELFAVRDKETIEAFGELLDKTGRRESTISDVTGRLMGELQTLAAFLDNVSSRRPRDTRSGQRPKGAGVGRRPVTGGSLRQRSAVSAVAAVNQSTGGPLPRLPSCLSSPDKSSLSRPTTVGSKTRSVTPAPPTPKSVTISTKT